MKKLYTIIVLGILAVLMIVWLNQQAEIELATSCLSGLHRVAEQTSDADYQNGASYRTALATHDYYLHENFEVSIIPTSLPSINQIILNDAARDNSFIVSVAEQGSIYRLQINDATLSANTSLIRGKLHYPAGLFLHQNWLYIAEQHQIVKYAFDGMQVTSNAQYVFKFPPSKIHFPRQIALLENNTIAFNFFPDCISCLNPISQPSGLGSFPLNNASNVTNIAIGIAGLIDWDRSPYTNLLFGIESSVWQTDNVWIKKIVLPWLQKFSITKNITNLPLEQQLLSEVNILHKGLFYGWPYLHGNNQKTPYFDNRKFSQSISIDQAQPALITFPAYLKPLSIKFIPPHYTYLPLRATPNSHSAVLLLQDIRANVDCDVSPYQLVQLIFLKNGEIVKKMLMAGQPADIMIEQPADIIIVQDNIYLTDRATGNLIRIKVKERSQELFSTTLDQSVTDYSKALTLWQESQCYVCHSSASYQGLLTNLSSKYTASELEQKLTLDAFPAHSLSWSEDEMALMVDWMLDAF